MNEEKTGICDCQGNGWRKALGVILWCVLAGAGLIGLYHRVSTGHHMADYGSYLPWGIWVGLYFHGVGMAAGVFLVGGLGFLSGRAGLETREALRSTIVLSLAALLPGLLAIGLDLGRFDRAARVFLDPNFSSVLTLNSWLYSLFMLTAALAWLASWRRESTWLRPLIVLGSLACFVFALGSGMFFGAVQVKPYWHNGIWPAVTLASALSAGAALLLLARCAATGSPCAVDQDAWCRLARRALQGGLVAYLLLAGAKWMTAHAYDAGQAHGTEPTALAVIPATWLTLGVGCIVPLLLLATGRRWCWMAASLLAAVGLLGGRLDLLLKGQAPAELPALPDAFHHARLTFAYQPTAMEWQVAALLVAIGMAVYFIGQVVNRTVASRMAAADQGVQR